VRKWTYAVNMIRIGSLLHVSKLAIKL